MIIAISGLGKFFVCFYDYYSFEYKSAWSWSEKHSRGLLHNQVIQRRVCNQRAPQNWFEAILCIFRGKNIDQVFFAFQELGYKGVEELIYAVYSSIYQFEGIGSIGSIKMEEVDVRQHIQTDKYILQSYIVDENVDKLIERISKILLSLLQPT